MNTVNQNVRERTDAQHALRVSVVVPTYLRPDWLVRCMQSLVEQTRRPDEVIAAIRVDDYPTREAFEAFVSRTSGCITFRKAIVTEAGFLPPVIAGAEAATGDIVAVIDDDAEANPDWLERLVRPYCDPQVVGVGGRYLNIYDGVEAIYPMAKRVGRFHWWGTFEGNMYRDVASDEVRPVDFLVGGNMSYRRDVLQSVRFDFALTHDVAFHYEVDLGMQVKRGGGRLLYDPMARIRHYSAPRVLAGMRKPTSETILWYNHNTLYIAMKHSSPFSRWLSAAYSFTIGATRSWGVLAAIIGVARMRTLQPLRELGPAFVGKARAIRNYLARTRSESSVTKTAVTA